MSETASTLRSQDCTVRKNHAMTYTSEARWAELRDTCLDLSHEQKMRLICMLCLDGGLDDLDVEDILRRLDDQDRPTKQRLKSVARLRS